MLKNTNEETVDVDRLTKAMEGVAASLSDKDDAAHDDNLNKALSEAEDIVEAVTRGADALLVEFRQQNEALAKGMLAMSERIVELTKRLDGGEVRKSLPAAGQPLRKSVSTNDVTVVPHPSDAKGMTRGEFIGKAIEELSKPETSAARRHELSKAVALAESGGDLTGIRKSLNL